MWYTPELTMHRLHQLARKQRVITLSEVPDNCAVSRYAGLFQVVLMCRVSSNLPTEHNLKMVPWASLLQKFSWQKEA